MTQNKTSGMFRFIEAAGLVVRSAVSFVLILALIIAFGYAAKVITAAMDKSATVTETGITVDPIERLTVTEYFNTGKDEAAVQLAALPAAQIRTVPEVSTIDPLIIIESWEHRVLRLVRAELEQVDQNGGLQRVRDPQLLCLAKNIYFESRGQPLAGQVGVAKVTLTRLEEGYASTICGVVRQRFVPNVCQFSWVCTHPNSRPVGEAWRLAVGIALAVLNNGGEIVDPTNGATHFHATYVRPSWSRRFAQHGQIGDHMFYRASTK